MKEPSAIIDNQRTKIARARALFLSQWIGLRPGQLAAWSMKTFLSFLVVAMPPYLLALHFHYSSEGILLSSAVAGSFGALLSFSKRSTSGAWSVTLGLFALCCSFYLAMPIHLNLLYALVVTSAFAIYITQQNPKNTVAGGRSELILTLNPFSEIKLLPILRRTLLLWALLSFVTHLLYKLTHMQWIALTPFLAIAVSCSAVQNSWAEKEHQ